MIGGDFNAMLDPRPRKTIEDESQTSSNCSAMVHFQFIVSRQMV